MRVIGFGADQADVDRQSARPSGSGHGQLAPFSRCLGLIRLPYTDLWRRSFERGWA